MWYHYAISHPAVNGFGSLLSGINIEEFSVCSYVFGYTNAVFI